MKQSIAFLVALLLIVAGVAWIYPPMGLVVAGGLLGASAWTYNKGATL